MRTCSICGHEDEAAKMVRSQSTGAYFCGPPDWEACSDRSLGLNPKASGLCERCAQNQALPDDDFCADCVGEVERMLPEGWAA